jgi:hypothetical protein
VPTSNDRGFDCVLSVLSDQKTKIFLKLLNDLNAITLAPLQALRIAAK